MSVFSLPRVLAVLAKEFTQLRRDRLTYAMILGMPVIQLLLFGYAINDRPAPPADRGVRAGGQRLRPLDAGGAEQHQLLRPDHAGPLARPSSTRCCAAARCSSPSPFPADFTRRVVRGDDPQILVEADATDPAATGGALAALAALPAPGPGPRPEGRRRAAAAPDAPPFQVVVHRRYNPERHHRLQHRARACWASMLSHDPGDDDRARRHPRARARHHGEPAGDAGAADRGDGRQARALCDRRR